MERRGSRRIAAAGAILSLGAMAALSGPTNAQTSTPAAGPAAPAAPPSPALAAAIATVQLYGPTVHPAVYQQNAYLTISTTQGRTQNVYVSAGVSGPASAQFRIVSSNAARLTAPIDPALMVRLLNENSSSLPYGYWALIPMGDGSQTLSYQVEMRTDVSAAAVQSIMTTVAMRTDALEAQLTGKDAY